jgi:hypothetical protein
VHESFSSSFRISIHYVIQSVLFVPLLPPFCLVLFFSARFLSRSQAFLLVSVLSTIMKLQHLVWLLATAVRAVPIVEPGQATVVGIAGPGPRFGVDREFHITMFADLHFGEGIFLLPYSLYDILCNRPDSD